MQAPTEYSFNEEDREKFGKRYWKCPRDLIESGEWAKAWQPSGNRGGGAIASIVPVLALASYPDSKSYAPPGLKLVPTFHPWATFSLRRIAKLGGVSVPTVRKALKQMSRLGWAHVRVVPCKETGGKKTWFCLSSKLWPSEHEPFAMIFGFLVYSGTWALLPTSSSRQLFVALAALDAIYNEDGLREQLEERDDEDEKTERVIRIRERKARSVSELMALSGLSRNALREAAEILTTPIFGSDNEIPLVHKSGDDTRAWYAVEANATRPALGWHFKPEALNVSASSLAELRRRTWPILDRLNRRAA